MLVLAVLAALISACAGREQTATFTDQYLQALREIPAAPFETEPALARFEAVFHNLTNEGLGPHIDMAYAETLFFNDTLHTFEQRSELVDYLERTGERLLDMQVGILGWSRQGDDLFVRWLMETEFRIAGRDKQVRTVGMTHLRFDQQGKITLHQDFWDSSQGLYEHVPLLGGLVRWIRGRL